MSKTPYADVISIFGGACQSLLGGMVVWLLTCVAAGAVPVLANTDWTDPLSRSELDWTLTFAWVGHLILATLFLWGIIVLCIHGLCLAALAHGTHGTLRVLSIVFVAQLTTSTIFVMLGRGDWWWRPALAWGLLSGGVAWRWAVSRRSPVRPPDAAHVRRYRA
jgi:hypothetical protein